MGASARCSFFCERAAKEERTPVGDGAYVVTILPIGAGAVRAVIAHNVR